MKYIDAEKLKAVLKAQIKERKEWMKDINRSNRQDQLWSDLNGEDMSILQIINSLQQEQPDDLASLISEATNVAKRIVDRDSFYNSLPQNLRDKYTFKAWCEILGALSTMKGKEQPEVDLEKEIEEYWSTMGWNKVMELRKFKPIARYFYGLGNF